MLKRFKNYFKFKYSDIIIIFFIFIIFIFVFVFKSFIYQNEVKNTEKRLKQIVNQQTIIINEVFNDIKNHIIMISEFVSLNINKNNIENFLSSYVKKQGLDYIYFVDKYGIGIDDNGNFINIYNEEYFKNALDRKIYFYVENKFENLNSNIIISVPILNENNESIGVIVGCFELLNLKFFDNFNDINESIITFIFDKNKNIIYNSNLLNKNYEYDSIENILKFLEPESVKIILNNINNFKTGILEYKDKEVDKDFFLYYTPLDIKDWYIMISVSEDYITNQINIINYATNELLFKISIFAVFIFIVIISFIKKINNNIVIMNNELKISEEAFKISAKQTNKTIFDYNIENKTITIIELNCFKSIPKIIENVPQAFFDKRIIPEKDKDIVTNAFKSIEYGSEKLTFINNIIENNNLYWAKIDIINIFDNNGKIINSVGVIDDITHKKNIEGLYIKEKNFKDIMTRDNTIILEVDMNNNSVIYDIKMKNLNSDSVKNLNFKQLCDIIEEKYIFKDDLNLFKNIINSEDNIKNIELRILINKNYIWVSVMKNIIKDPFYGINKCFYYIKDIDKIKQESIKLKIQAETDQLTGIFNRKTVEQKINENMNFNNNCIFILIDVDKFKFVNDTYGHSIGDEVLKITSKRIKNTFRSNDIVGRIGGDEFIVFMTAIDDLNIVNNKAKILSSPYKYIIGEIEFELTLSIGISKFPFDGINYQDLYKKADKALYDSKKEGRGRFTFYK